MLQVLATCLEVSLLLKYVTTPKAEMERAVSTALEVSATDLCKSLAAIEIIIYYIYIIYI